MSMRWSIARRSKMMRRRMKRRRIMRKRSTLPRRRVRRVGLRIRRYDHKEEHEE